MAQSGIRCKSSNAAVCRAVEDWFELQMKAGAVGQYRGEVNDSDNRPGVIVISIESSGGPTNVDAPMRWSDSSKELANYLRERGFAVV